MGLFSKKKKDEKEKEAKQTEKKEIKEEQKGLKKESAKKALDSVAGKKQKEEKEKEKKVSSKSAYKILIKPIVTEKAANLSAENKYVFEVAKNANKIEVAKAVLEVYGIKPVNVNVMNFKGKKISRGRFFGKRKDWRKAVVSLEKGKTINVYEGI